MNINATLSQTVQYIAVSSCGFMEPKTPRLITKVTRDQDASHWFPRCFTDAMVSYIGQDERKSGYLGEQSTPPKYPRRHKTVTIYKEKRYQ